MAQVTKRMYILSEFLVFLSFSKYLYPKTWQFMAYRQPIWASMNVLVSLLSDDPRADASYWLQMKPGTGRPKSAALVVQDRMAYPWRGAILNVEIPLSWIEDQHGWTHQVISPLLLHHKDDFFYIESLSLAYQKSQFLSRFYLTLGILFYVSFLLEFAFIPDCVFTTVPGRNILFLLKKKTGGGSVIQIRINH